jgi:hypothetical protein
MNWISWKRTDDIRYNSYCVSHDVISKWIMTEVTESGVDLSHDDINVYELCIFGVNVLYWMKKRSRQAK